MLTRNVTGQIVGILTFLGGVALLLLTFRLSYDLFQTPPSVALGLQPGEPVDLNRAGASGILLFVRVLTLLVMCIVSSVICNRGIRLYQAAVGEIKAHQTEHAPPTNTDAAK